MAMDPRNIRARTLLISDYTRLAGVNRLMNRPAEAQKQLHAATKLADSIADPKTGREARELLAEETAKQAGK